MLPIASTAFIIWYICEFDKAHYIKCTQSLLSCQHLALAITQSRKKGRIHPLKSVEKFTALRMELQDIYTVMRMPTGSSQMVPPAEFFPYVLCEEALKCNLGLLFSEMLVLEANLTPGSQTLMMIKALSLK